MAAAEGSIVYRGGQRGDDALFNLDPRTGESAFLAPIPPSGGGAQSVYSPERTLLIWARGGARFPFDANLFAYDPPPETEWQLTSIEGVAAYRPSLSGDILAWESRPTTPSPVTDVYVARLAEAAPQAAPSPAIAKGARSSPRAAGTISSADTSPGVP